MLYFILKPGQETGIHNYFSSSGRSLAPLIGIRNYDWLFRSRTLPLSAYVFADIDRLSNSEAEFAANVWQHLHSRFPRLPLLNHPTRSMRRYELLRTLKEQTINVFDVYRITEARSPRRFPVFLRRGDEHGDIISPLLHTREEFDTAVEEFSLQGRSREDILIVEFADTADQRGIYRKYSAFIIGDRVIAHHLLFSQDWCVRIWDLEEAEMLQEEFDFVMTNPHAEQLKAICTLAGIGYGRIDYAMLHGVPQIWEINTNPNFTRSLTAPSQLRHAHREFANAQMNLAFQEVIDCMVYDSRRTINPLRRPLVRKRIRRALHSLLRMAGLSNYEESVLDSVRRNEAALKSRIRRMRS